MRLRYVVVVTTYCFNRGWGRGTISKYKRLFPAWVATGVAIAILIIEFCLKFNFSMIYAWFFFFSLDHLSNFMSEVSKTFKTFLSSLISSGLLRPCQGVWDPFTSSTRVSWNVNFIKHLT